MRTILIKIGLFALIVTIASSCKKDYLDRYPLSGPSAAVFYTNQDELMLGLNGCYRGLNFTTKDKRPWSIILDVTTDVDWNRSNHPLQDIGKGSHASNNDAVLVTWREFYVTIGRCNFLLDNVEKLRGTVNTATLDQIKSEARFVRALSYHYLVEFFGGVPLITKTLTLEEAQVPRNAKSEVTDFILKEMDEIAPLLPLTQGTTTGRATRGAALALKARTALFANNYTVAAQAAQAVMNLNTYQLHPDFIKLFTYEGETSKEIIFSLQYQKGVLTHMNPNVFVSRLAGGVSNEVPPQALIDSYECTDGNTIDKSPLFNPARPFDNRDPRLAMTIALPGSILFGYQFETNPDSLMVWNYNVTPARRVANTDATNAFATYTGYLYRKYTDIKDMPDDENSDIDIMLFRYAEVLLIYAEAKIEANSIDASVFAALNAVRQRPGVGLPSLPSTLNQAQLRSVVRRERKVELALEGLRLFDIRRWRIAEQVMPGPFLGRIPKEFLSNAPVIDANGTPDYTNVGNRSKMRLVETRIFDKDRDYLWPIPSIELLTNPKLVQNPKY